MARNGAFKEGNHVRWRIWAPERKTVELVIFNERGTQEVRSIPMQREPDGNFSVALEGIPFGTLYKYRVDGDGPWPDPYSRFQPLGVHGPAMVVDQRFDWTDAHWKGIPPEQLVIYELHVGTATPEGTFDALIGRLDDIKAVGCNAIELMPLADFPGSRNWGYDGVSLYAPSRAYGGPDGLRRLINAAHARGIAVIIDAVYNHLGPDGNYVAKYSDHYFTHRHKTAWGDAVNLDGPESGPVRAWLLDNAEMWMRVYHADGLRLDATHALVDESTPHILQEIALRVRQASGGRHVHIIAEDERNEVKLLKPLEQGGYGLTAAWADDFHHQVRRAFAGDSEGYFSDFSGTAADLAATLQKGWFYEGQHSEHADKNRGTPAVEADIVQFIHHIQNHDQVGNRATGERLGKAIDGAAYRAASALLLLTPATPMLFMGQEWNASTPFLYFTDHHDELGRAVTEGRRKEFKDFSAFSGQEVPDPQAPSTLEASRLNWSERNKPEHAGVLEWYRELLALRARHPAMQQRSRKTFRAWAIGEHTVALERAAPDIRLLLLVNIRGSVSLTLPEGSWSAVAFSEEARFGGTRPLPVVDREVDFQGAAALLLESRR